MIISMLGAMLAAAPITAAASYEIELVVDQSGAGGINTLDGPSNLVVDASGNLFVAGSLSGNVLKVTLDGQITEIIDASGDGQGATLSGAYGLAVNALGHVFVGGTTSDNVFQISPNGAIREIISPAGDGLGGDLNQVGTIAVGANGSVYVSGVISGNVLSAALGGVDELANRQDGLNTPGRVRVNDLGEVFVHDYGIIYRISPEGYIYHHLNTFDDLSGFYFESVVDFDFDTAGNLYLVGSNSDNVLRVSPNGDIEEIINADGDGAGNELDNPYRIAFDSEGSAYVVGYGSNNVFRITTDGAIAQIADLDGDGLGNTLDGPSAIAVDNEDRVYVLASRSDLVLRLTPRIEQESNTDNDDESAADGDETKNGTMPDETTDPSTTGSDEDEEKEGGDMIETETATSGTESICGTGVPMSMPMLALAMMFAGDRRSRRFRRR